MKLRYWELVSETISLVENRGAQYHKSSAHMQIIAVEMNEERSPRIIPNKAEDRETYRESVNERHMARHSQREAVLHEWAATENNMLDSAPCVFGLC